MVKPAAASGHGIDNDEPFDLVGFQSALFFGNIAQRIDHEVVEFAHRRDLHLLVGRMGICLLYTSPSPRD